MELLSMQMAKSWSMGQKKKWEVVEEGVNVAPQSTVKKAMKRSFMMRMVKYSSALGKTELSLTQTERF